MAQSISDGKSLVKTQDELGTAGFTASGAKRYRETVEAYESSLYNKALSYAEIDKASDTSLEVTHDHVRAAAHTLAASFGRDRPSGWSLVAQIGEYLFTASAGVGGGALVNQTTWAVPLFALSVALAVILFVARHTILKN